MRSNSSNLYSFSGLGSSSSYKNPISSNPSSSSYSSYASSTGVPALSRFSSPSINPSSPLLSSASSFLFDPPTRKLSSITDYASSPSSSSSSSSSAFESRLSSRRASSTDPRGGSAAQQSARQTRTSDTDSLLELYGVRGRGAGANTEPAKRKSSALLDDRKKGGLPTLEEDAVRFRRGSREGLFDLPGSTRDARDLLLGGRSAGEGGRFGEKAGGPSSSVFGAPPGGMAGELNQIEYTNRLLEAHKRVDDLLRKRGLSAEDERKYLRAWEEIPVVRDVRMDNYAAARRARSHSSDSGLSTDSDETKERALPTVDIEADEDWEMDEFDEASAHFTLTESPLERVEMTMRAFSSQQIVAERIIERKPAAQSARHIFVQLSRCRAVVSASFKAASLLKIAVVDVEKSMKKRIHKEGVLKSLVIRSMKRAVAQKKVLAAPAVIPAPVVIKKDDKSCVFRAPSRSSIHKREPSAEPSKPGLLDKVLLRKGRPQSAVQGADSGPETMARPVLRKVRTGSLDTPEEMKRAASPKHQHALDACKTLLASLRPKRDRLSRSSAEISVQHCSFFQTAQTIIQKARIMPEKNVRINLRLTERAPNREKAKIVLACARVAIARLDINIRAPVRRRRTIQLMDPPLAAPEKRPVGRLERAMTLETPFVRTERPVKPLQIPQSFLEKSVTHEEPETKEDFKAAREKLRKVPFVDCLTGLDLPIYWLDSPGAAAIPKAKVAPKRKEGEKKERLLDRLMKKEKESIKEEAEVAAAEKKETKLKRQNAFKKKKRHGEPDSVSLGGIDSSVVPEPTTHHRRAASVVSKTRKAASKFSLPSLLLPAEEPSHAPSPFSAEDQALIRSFRASLSIPKPAAMRRPITPTPLDSAERSQANYRLRDYKSPPPPPAFMRRRTPPRK